MLRLLVTEGLLRSFQVRNYRFFWASNTSVRFAEQMQLLVLSYFVRTEISSVFLLGLFGALRFGGTLFGAAYGVVVERSNRRLLLIGVRLTVSILSATILLLVVTGRLEPWHVFIITGLGGLTRAFDNITKQTMLADVMRKEELINAMALDRTGSDASQIVGPLLGGLMLRRFGMGPAFVVIVAVYLLAVFCALFVRPVNPVKAEKQPSMWRSLVEGGDYIRRHDAVLALLLFAFLINLAAFPLTHGMMPVFALDVLHTGPMGLAALTSAVAAGAFIGSFGLAAKGGFAKPGVMAVLAVVSWCMSIMVFTQSSWMAVSLAILLASGVAQSFSLVSVDSLLLRLAPLELRARIMGIRSMAVYGLPMGLLAIGAMADILGAPRALAIMAAAGAVLTLVISAWLRELWSAS
ncbi:MAG: MFS transporter [Dehalococcoidia bacterium]|nr:MFS transporter [Dehalococcoidia bacterium]